MERAKSTPTVLVTGAGGFVGRAVVAALQGRAEVVLARADGRRADLLDRVQRRQAVAEAKADILIHLAWVTEHGKFWTSPLNAAWAAASADLFQAFYAVGGRRIVGTGTCAEYDWTDTARQLTETAPLGPRTAYGAAKLRTSVALANAAAHAQASRQVSLQVSRQASWAWARVFFTFGPGEPPGRLIPLMLRAVRTRAPLAIGPADTVRDFMPVAALGQAIADLALSDLQGPVNTASGTGIRFDTLAEMIERMANCPGIVQPNGRPLGAGEPQTLVADTGRLGTVSAAAEQPGVAAALAEALQQS